MGDNEAYLPPEMPPMPSTLDPNSKAGCPPCQYPPMQMGGMGGMGGMGPMMMYPSYHNHKSRRHKSDSRDKGGEARTTFFIMLVSAAFFATGIWFSIRLPSYAPGGSREDAKTFTFVQILSTSLISAGVLLLVIAWFTGK